MPELYTVKMLGHLFGKGEQTIRTWITHDKVFPHAFKVKKEWFVPESDVKKIVPLLMHE